MAVTKNGFFGSLAAFGLSLLLFLIGFGAPKWHSGSANFSHWTFEASMGLWQVCHGGVCASITDASDSFRAVQAMMVFALLSVLGATAAYVIWLIAVLQDKSTKEGMYGLAAKLAGILVTVAGVFDLIGILVFGIELNGVPSGYAYWLAVLSTGGFLIIGPITIMLHRGRAEQGNDQGKA